jgi:hypothetical protein
VLQAEHLVDQQPGEHIVVLHHQHPPLFARGRQLVAEKPHRSMIGSKRPRRLATP